MPETAGGTAGTAGAAALEAELRALGRSLPAAPPPDDLMAAVLDRIAAEPVPGRPSPAGALLRQVAGWLRARWRAAVAVLAGLLVVLALAPPVRATVAEWFGFGGVIVRQQPGSPPSSAPPPPVGRSRLSLEQARRLVAFEPLLPAELGPPTTVAVSADRRVLSMTWSGVRGVAGAGIVRLDQFNGQMEPRYWKTVKADVRYVGVGGRDGVWVPVAHELVVLGPDGTEHHEPSRLAGPTLVWGDGATTLRLEGVPELTDALRIAESAR